MWTLTAYLPHPPQLTHQPSPIAQRTGQPKLEHQQCILSSTADQPPAGRRAVLLKCNITDNVLEEHCCQRKKP